MMKRLFAKLAENCSAKVLVTETDKMLQFLAPEIDSMGMRIFIISICTFQGWCMHELKYGICIMFVCIKYLCMFLANNTAFIFLLIGL